MFYIFQPLHHLNRISQWVKDCNGQVHVSADTFALSIHLAGRVIRLQPRFSTKVAGRMGYTRLFDGKGAFIGWVPDASPTWPESLDKARFKLSASKLKLRVPAGWNSGEFLAEDYLIKPRNGSFGANIVGPYKTSLVKRPLAGPEQFYEQFIPGRSMKIWCWNQHVAAVEVIEPPYLIGDGRRSLQELAGYRRSNVDKVLSLDTSADILAWQGVRLDSVPKAGERIWIDFKYVTPFDNVTFLDRDNWNACSSSVRHQVAHAAASLYKHISEELQNLLFTIDAVVDHEDRVWLLEMNSHPMVHPNIYPLMLPDICRPPNA
ncbi:hypothetical protein Herbaro_10240 [Herbaspirillum sp. WKF16]|uniref:hypothetical protein n=1 Tax=Herbaspirillum sp. WKF16 TaxID=3028312 RepID=UPI0023A9BBEE|nr:hypothetical protein [Herbaspirillum sp. WKF16]WDZ98138.1 hypothetical protein Herbaro_10240 [Herbaspirillum sp. WKF16]